MTDDRTPHGCDPAGPHHEARSGETPARCPRCGSDEVLTVLYGLIDEPVDMTRFSLGGCILGPERWSCGRCLHRW